MSSAYSGGVLSPARGRYLVLSVAGGLYDLLDGGGKWSFDQEYSARNQSLVLPANHP
jgi:hypothetical protein